jgi:hypothetical protein
MKTCVRIFARTRVPNAPNTSAIRVFRDHPFRCPTSLKKETKTISCCRLRLRRSQKVFLSIVSEAWAWFGSRKSGDRRYPRFAFLRRPFSCFKRASQGDSSRRKRRQFLNNRHALALKRRAAGKVAGQRCGKRLGAVKGSADKSRVPRPFAAHVPCRAADACGQPRLLCGASWACPVRPIESCPRGGQSPRAPGLQRA